MKHTTMINQAVQAVPTMIDRSIATMKSDINKSSGNPECVEKAEDGKKKVILYKFNDN